MGSLIAETPRPKQGAVQCGDRTESASSSAGETGCCCSAESAGTEWPWNAPASINEFILDPFKCWEEEDRREQRMRRLRSLEWISVRCGFSLSLWLHVKISWTLSARRAETDLLQRRPMPLDW